MDKQKILKKLNLASELFRFAFTVKRYHIQKKYPQLSEKELNHKAYSLIEKGCK